MTVVTNMMYCNILTEAMSRYAPSSSLRGARYVLSLRPQMTLLGHRSPHAPPSMRHRYKQKNTERSVEDMLGMPRTCMLHASQ